MTTLRVSLRSKPGFIVYYLGHLCSEAWAALSRSLAGVVPW